MVYIRPFLKKTYSAEFLESIGNSGFWLIDRDSMLFPIMTLFTLGGDTGTSSPFENIVFGFSKSFS